MEKKKFISYPSKEALNPFIRILNGHMQSYGWEECFYDVWRKPLRLYKLRKEIQLVHFHWPETFWRSENKWISFIKGMFFMLYIRYMKGLGIKTSFSVHNVLPHYKPGNMWFEKIMRRWIIKNFDLTIGHALNTREEIVKKLNVSPVSYLEALHGIYEGHYGPAGLQVQARKAFGIPIDKKVILLSVSHHPYKGTNLFIEQWLANAPNLFLLIVGKPSVEMEKEILKVKHVKVIAEDSNGIAGFISEKTLAEAYNACDFVALPYKEITTSGAFFLALTFDKPIIAPDLSFFKLHTADGSTALLYDHVKRDISGVLRNIESGWEPDTDQLAKLKQKYSWKDSAKSIAALYDSLIK
jgi:beta-1,4-mannosyltransferase